MESNATLTRKENKKELYATIQRLEQENKQLRQATEMLLLISKWLNLVIKYIVYVPVRKCVQLCYWIFDIEYTKEATAHVQIYAAFDKTLSEKIMDDLEKMLKMEFEKTNTIIRVDKYQHPPEDTTAPLIVLCMNASRLGADVKVALSNISESMNKAVVVLHHAPVHALPKISSEEALLGLGYKDIAILDMAYMTTKGIYQCEMNTNSLHSLKTFIHSNSDNKSN